MDEQIERFLNYIYRKNSQSERTIESYKQDLEQFKQYLSSESIESFDDVTRNVMLNYIVSLDDLKSSSIARKLSTYRSFYAYLNEYMGIPNNPMTQIKGPKIDKKIPDFLFPEEIGFFLETYDDSKPNEYRDRMLFTLMYASGLRVSEICQLTWPSVDLDDRVLHIIGKGDKARIVPFFKGLESELSNYKKTYWAKYAKDETVFVNNHGKALTIRGVYYLMNKHAQNIGMDMKLHPHMLRHSFATHLLDNGADIRVVQELLGHASLSTTQIYTHVSLNQLKKAYHDAHPLEKRVETKH